MRANGAKFAAARFVIPKDDRILNYCSVDLISNLRLHLGIKLTYSLTILVLGWFSPVDNTLSEALCWRRMLQHPCERPVARTCVTPTHSPVLLFYTDVQNPHGGRITRQGQCPWRRWKTFEKTLHKYWRKDSYHAALKKSFFLLSTRREYRHSFRSFQVLTCSHVLCLDRTESNSSDLPSNLKKKKSLFPECLWTSTDSKMDKH